MLGSSITSWASESSESEQVEVAFELEEAEAMQEDLEESLLSGLDVEEIDLIIADIFPDERISFIELIQCILSGSYEDINELVYSYITSQIFYEIAYSKSTLVHILVLVIFAAVFTNFAQAFGNEQISNMGFYIIYLLLLMVTLQSFQVIVEGVAIKIEEVLLFMSVLCPVYFLAVALASGTTSAVMFYNLSLLYIYIVELLVASVVLPLITTYISVQALNYLTMEKRLSKLSDLIKLIISWTLKVMLAGVIGLNVVQGLITPVIDQVKRDIWVKSAEAIPLVGDMMSGTAEVILGTLKIIKNGIGVVGLILCLLLVMGPIIQMALLTLLYKLVAAMVQPISDKRICSCIHSIGEGCEMLLKAILSVSILFLATIAIVASTT